MKFFFKLWFFERTRWASLSFSVPSDNVLLVGG